ncbi:MAG: hypothetical protein HGA80_06045 [Candidatus Omnitrophica bacterium]|nr:hypothetical protein [Candidatus Omnitrophota bacterium]
MDRMHGLVLPFVHAAMILAVSFFVLFANSRVESKRLRAFGYVVAVILWLAALLTIGGIGRSAFRQGQCPMAQGHMGRFAPDGRGMAGRPMPMHRDADFDGQDDARPFGDLEAPPVPRAMPAK